MKEILEFLTSEKAVILYLVIVLLLVMFLMIFIFVKYGDKKEKKIKNQRFYSLNKLDKLEARQVIDKDITLKDFCIQFQAYAANLARPLYYRLSEIQSFVSSLATSRIIILQGVSGTGKTSLAYAFGKFIQNEAEIIPVQPMWKERSDLLGYYNEFTNKYHETPLLKRLYTANIANNEPHLVVLDEMNISRVEYYFAEFLSLLELPGAKYIPVVNNLMENDPIQIANNQGKIMLADNVWFIGTANNDDSTYTISDKVYDRAMVLNFDRLSPKFKVEPVGKCPISYKKLTSLFSEATENYGLSDKNLVNMIKLNDHLLSRYNISIGNRIMNQFQKYVATMMACGAEEIMAIDDFICKKILYKLAAINTFKYEKELIETQNYLNELFGNLENTNRVLKGIIG